MARSVELATGYISLAVSSRGLGRDVAKQFTGIEKQSVATGKRAGRSFGRSFGGSLEGIGGALKGVFASAVVLKGAQLLVRGIKSSVLAASDLNETINKSNAIFGKNAGVINKWSKNAATSLGLSRQQALDAAASFGDMFKQIGFSDQAASKMSRSTVQLAADLGSFNNLPTADVQERISAAFRGEYDSLQKVIPNISAARVQQVALAESGKKSVTQLTAQEKAHATLTIIQKDGKRAVGDFAKTQDELANKTKTVKAQLEDLKGQIGKFFLPALKDVFNYISKEIIPAFKDFFDGLKKDKALKDAVANLKDALKGVTDQDFKQSLDDIAKALPPIVQGMADVVTKMNEFDAWTKAHGGDKKGGDQYSGLGGVFYNNGLAVNHWIKKMWVDMKTSFIEGHTEVLNDVKGFVGGVIGWFVNLTDRARRMWADLKTSFVQGGASIVAETKKFIDPIIVSFVYVKGKVVAWVSRMWGDVKSSFIRNHASIVADIKGFVNRIVDWFANLKARVTAWVSRMWGDVKSSFIRNHASVLADVNRWVGRVAGWFSTLKSRAATIVRSMSTTVRDVIGTMLDKVTTAFSKGVTAIGKAWDDIKAVVKKPIRFVVETVLDNGILAAIRSISKFVNYGPGKNVHVGLPKGFATGTSQVLPGYTPGRDVHRFVSATGGILDLSGGEGIARPEVVKAVGKKRWDEINLAAAHGRLTKAQGYLGAFAQGTSFLGGQRPVGPGSTHRHSGYSWARWAGDLSASMNTPVHAWKSGVIATVKYLTSSYGRHIIENVGGSRVYYAHLARAIVHAGQSVRQGQTIGYSDSTGNSTGPHLHFEIRGGSAPIGGSAGGGGSILAALSPAKWLKMASGALGKLSSIKDSPFGEMAAAGAELIGDKIKGKITDLAASFVQTIKGAAGAAFTALSGGSNRSLGRRMMLQRWSIANWPALNSLWTRESGWRTTARNPSSGAYGIPQSLPASKMASAGSDWRTNPATQIKWGLGYIASRYGSPIKAWAHSRATGWYASGTQSAAPGLAVVGERGPEVVNFRGGESVTPLSGRSSSGVLTIYGGVHGYSAEEVAEEIDKKRRRQQALRPAFAVA